jgi:hypothetical protein|tara:strand:- start:3519 stop:4514 length:996 start_codon:yes stop_codon:yes gene_type:complete
MKIERDDLPMMLKEDQMDFPTYLGDPMPEPSMTSSIVRELIATAPRKVWEGNKRLNPKAESTQKTIFDLGTAAHKLFTGSGEPIVVIDAKAFQSNDAKAQRDAAYAAGKTPILIGNMPRVKAMAAAALEQFSENPDIGPFLRGEKGELLREATIMWVEDGVMHRCRPDFYSAEHNVIIHYKTTGVSIAPNDLAKYAAGAGWYLTAAHYGAGAKFLAGRAPKQFFAVQETDAPHLCVVAELDATFIAAAHMRRTRSMMIWGRCIHNNTWPGFPSRTVKLECPEWLERNLTADKDAENEATKAGKDLLDYAQQWQAPNGWQAPSAMGSDEVIE